MTLAVAQDPITILLWIVVLVILAALAFAVIRRL